MSNHDEKMAKIAKKIINEFPSEPCYVSWSYKTPIWENGTKYDVKIEVRKERKKNG